MDGPGGIYLAERTAAARQRESQYSKSSNLDCEIELEGSVYYDGDILRGEVCINAKEDGIYRNVLVLLLCRFIGRDPALSPRERCTTLHLSKYPLAAEMHIPQGLTKVPFEFAIPENVPSTFSSKWGDVVWMARLIHENPDGKSRMPLATLAKALFEKRSIYYPLPSYEPTAQGERRIFGTGHSIKVEAKLAKDVHASGEAVEVTIVVHQEANLSLKKPPKIAIKKIKVEIVQSIDAQKSGRKQVCKSYVLDRCKHMVATWAVTKLAEPPSILTERTFSMRPAADPNLKCAHQTFINPKTEDHDTVLAATAKLYNSQTSSGLEVKYNVNIKLVMRGTSDISMTLPFVIESPRPCGAGEIGAADDALRDRLVFPIVDEPPEYHYHHALSVPSYTSLRRNSNDSVFVSPSLLDMDDEIIPSYKDISASGLDGPKYPARGRLSLHSINSLTQDQVHRDIQRRNSFAGWSFLRRRSSRDVFAATAHTTPPIADADEGVKDEEDQLAMLKMKYSNVRDRSNPHGPHSMSDAELRQLPSNQTLDAAF